MKDNIKELNFESELSPEESAAIDRILSDCAEAENSEVDYASMLASIKARARKERISVFAPAKKKNTAKRVFTGIGAAAAVFVVGLAAFAVIRALPFPGASGKYASADHAPQGDKVVETAEIGNVLPDPGKTVPGVTAEAKDPGAAVIATPDPEPVNTEDAADALPTLCPIKGGIVGYVRLTDFLSEPTCSAQLVPDMLPEFMEFKLGEAELFAAAYGMEDEVKYSYSCRVAEAPEEEFDIGIARFIELESGSLTYLWHVCEGVYLEVEFAGFDRAAAEEMLYSIVLCNMEDIPSTPAPSEEAA